MVHLQVRCAEKKLNSRRLPRAARETGKTSVFSENCRGPRASAKVFMEKTQLFLSPTAHTLIWEGTERHKWECHGLDLREPPKVSCVWGWNLVRKGGLLGV